MTLKRLTDKTPPKKKYVQQIYLIKAIYLKYEKITLTTQ